MNRNRVCLFIFSAVMSLLLVYCGLYIYLFSTPSFKILNNILLSRIFPFVRQPRNITAVGLLEKINLVNLVNCKKLFDGDYIEMNKTYKLLETFKPKPITDTEYISMTKSCDSFLEKRGYIMRSLSSVEETFPLAFSMLMYKDVYQAERLLRAIYRPQNIYCIHVDRKAARDVKDAMTSIASCFDNVFIASQLYDVEWGTISVLDAELSCMRDLLDKHKSWKYFINLTGQEFPLRTNYELVKILLVYDGANDIMGGPTSKWQNRWAGAGTPPHGIRPMKGGTHILANRDFVDFLVNNRIAQDVYNWTKYTIIPDEIFFNTMNHNSQLGVRGQYNGSIPPNEEMYFSRIKIWTYSLGADCHGEIDRGICIFGIGDLPLLKTRKEFIFNKFHWDFQSFTLDCIEELYFNTTRDEYLGIKDFNTSVYETALFVKYKIQ
ncbi:hypothetical protein CHS0354_008303 [Potamilus streckersoni]|uniref:Beta-1,3-galactosyl-O-glycosyl-glycoprotein beta-1,6-N-acetylglucosaminyltransferase n=1 Tax=Potamilus streckersoni TaxID=2493646 RepID=A0AAE0SC78_9BIVA|nr:hypothetical protein CHS0354_008303 [Potamilus streckersoni]